MFILYAVPLGVLVGLLVGGRLDGIAQIRFRWAPLAILGFAAQIVLFSGAVDHLIGTTGPALYVTTTLIVLAAVLRNIAVPGLALVALGAASNLAAILANGGRMPSDPDAYRIAGIEPDEGFSNSVLTDTPALRPLTDIYAIPAEWPFANVFSIGDVLIGVGVFLTIVLAMRRAGRTAPDGTGPDTVHAGNSPD